MLLKSQPAALASNSAENREGQKALPPAKNAVQAAQSTVKISPIRRRWQDLNLRPKLIFIMILVAGLPVLVVTQLLVKLSGDNALSSNKIAVREKGGFFTSEYVMWTNQESKSDAESIAKNIRDFGIDLNNQKAIAPKLGSIQSLLSLNSDGVDPESIKNFKIVTDAQGRTIAHNIQVVNEDFSLYPPLPAKDSPFASQIYKTIPIAPGTDMNVLPIVKDAIATGKPLYGIELLKSPALQAIGIDKQANIGVRPQVIQGLADAKQPVPIGTYDLDGGKAGLVSVAVYPIKVKDKLVGTVVVGSLLNRNYGIVDKFTRKYNITIASIFAQDLRVSTNTEYVDPATKRSNNTRAIGTRVSSEVARAVLDNEQKFIGEVNVAGDTQLAFYEPLYDHQRLLNPKAKPIGISAVASRIGEIDAQLANLRAYGYGVGLASLLVAGGIAAVIAGSFANPIRKLANFTQRVGKGEMGLRYEGESDRRDEVGILSQELNRMMDSMSVNLSERERESQRVQLFAQLAAASIETSATMSEVLNQLTAGARKFLECDRVVVYQFRSDRSGYIAAESVIPGLPLAIKDKVNDACIPESLLQAYAQGRVVATDDLSKRNYHPDHVDLLRRLQIKANLVVPMLQRGEPFGLLIAHHCYQTHAWQPSEIEFLQQLAAQIGISLDRTSFLTEVESSRQQAEQVASQNRQARESLQKSALELLMQVDPVSRGDLTIRANVTADEIGTIADSYNALIRSLRKILTEVQDATQSVTANTQKNEKAVKTVATDALLQSESIQAALEQIQVMASSIKGVENRAQQAEQQMQRANQVVREGDAAMNKTVASITSIRDTVTEATEKVKTLDQASQKISKVVKLISGFAAQTNLLALNASIEAARAGEEGEGFGVVADEVRALAQRSAAATTEIRILVEEIQNQTQEVVKSMASGSEQVVIGFKLVEESRQKLTQVNEVSTQVNKLVQEIAKAAAIQSQASSTMGQKIQDVSAIAQYTSKQSEQVASSFTELLEIAQKLQVSISQFKL